MYIISNEIQYMGFNLKKQASASRARIGGLKTFLLRFPDLLLQSTKILLFLVDLAIFIRLQRKPRVYPWGSILSKRYYDQLSFWKTACCGGRNL
jgi:hypothetical protein